ncbi:MAG: FHA domain-containing protein [Xanthomonadales bacterium]|nr:FHA domain-containing protein [Xanthomonadales bacterium]
MGSAVLSGIIFWLVISRRAGKQIKERQQRAAEAETVRLSSDGLPMRATRVAREKQQQEETPFVPGTRPPGSTGWLRIEGSHADGRPLRAVTAVNDGNFKAIIGRAGAELNADGPGISRQHAQITIEQGRMTITDLGSVNGTFVNGVRCQRDEIFMLNDGDQLLLGAAPVTVKLSKARGHAP